MIGNPAVIAGIVDTLRHRGGQVISGFGSGGFAYCGCLHA